MRNLCLVEWKLSPVQAFDLAILAISIQIFLKNLSKNTPSRCATIWSYSLENLMNCTRLFNIAEMRLESTDLYHPNLFLCRLMQLLSVQHYILAKIDQPYCHCHFHRGQSSSNDSHAGIETMLSSRLGWFSSGQ